MDPINYNIDVASPLDSTLKGYQSGLLLNEQTEQLQQKRLARQMQLQLQTDVNKLAANPNPTATDYASIMTRYPQLSEHFKKSWDVLNAEQQKNKLESSSRIFAALQNDPEVAATILDGQAQAAENSGMKQEAQSAKALAQLARTAPNVAKALAGIQFGSVAGIDKLTSAISTLGTNRRAEELQPDLVAKGKSEAGKAASDATIKSAEAGVAEVKAKADLERVQAETNNANSQINDRIEQRRLARDKFVTETNIELRKLDQKESEVPEDARKLANTTMQSAIGKINNADKSADLADRIETRLKTQGGLATRGWSATLKALGMEGEQQALQQEFARLRNSNIMANLPSSFSNNFSNADRSFVEKGIPDENANPQYIAGFLRTMDKTLRAEATADRAAGSWVSRVHSLGPATKDIDVDGIKVPKGTSFTDYTSMVMKKQRDSNKKQDVLSPYEEFLKSRKGK